MPEGSPHNIRAIRFGLQVPGTALKGGVCREEVRCLL